MARDIIVEKTLQFAHFTRDPHFLQVLLLIAKNNGMYIEDMIKETGLSAGTIYNVCEYLEKVSFIEENPHPQLNKRYVLSFNGQLLIENLKNIFPSVRDILGNESFIRPLAPFV
ncbi:MAG TPA: hypothetical protein VJH88_02985 [Candidatus Nanoarchaeia archaeon]|nr:hypothetical protein [Candidatus Nanoarchaeia archaeon]